MPCVALHPEEGLDAATPATQFSSAGPGEDAVLCGRALLQHPACSQTPHPWCCHVYHCPGSGCPG